MNAGGKKPLISFEPARVTSKEEIAPGVYVVRFEKSFHFEAGQVVAVKLDESEPHRLYSLASGKEEPDAAILFDINPEGLLTPRLAGLTPGDKILVSPAFGFFIDDESPAWWIATGTGIAPFYSMFKSLKTENKVLIHGGRTIDSFYFQNEFKKTLGDRYVRCSSKEKGEGVYPGRLTRYLMSQPSFDPAKRYFLCGNAEMVVDVRDFLIARGVPFENIRAEIYF